MSNSLFESIKKIDKNGQEFWMAREFSKVLGYDRFINFENAIQKAKISFHNGGYNSQDHLPDVGEMLYSRKWAACGLSCYNL